MSTQSENKPQGKPWENIDIRTIVIVAVTIAVFIWSLLYFVDKPNPRRAEEAPLQIGLNQAVAEQVWLGADIEDVTPDLVTKLELHAQAGAYVNKVFPGSPAELGGLKRDDVITSIDSTKIASVGDISTYLQSKKIGDRIKIRVMRNDTAQGLSVTLKSKLTHDQLNAKVGAKVAANMDADAWLGIEVQSLDAVIVRQMKLPDTRGVIISHVATASPAAEIGLVRGDVIRTIDKTPISDRVGLAEILLNKKPGDTLKIEVIRNGKLADVTITATAMPTAATADTGAPVTPELPPADVEVEASWLGLTIVPLDPLEAKELGLPSQSRGMVVDGISIGPAFDAGFQVGDILMAINGMPTATLRQFKEATEGAQGAMVDVWRGGRHRFVTVAVPGFDRQGKQLPNSAAASQIAQQLPVDNGMRYVAVAAMGPDASSQVAPIFAKSPFYNIIDLKKNTITPVANAKSEATGIIAANFLLKNHIDAVLVGRIGPRAFDALTNSKVAVYPGVFGPLSDVVQAFREGKLQPSAAVLGSTVFVKR